MFVQHKPSKGFNVPASRVARLNSSGCNVQMAFPGYPPQMCAAYLVSLSSGPKVMILVIFYLSESRQSIFYVPKCGEVSVEDAEKTFEEAFVFAETMGFVLNETDFHLLSAEDQQKHWNSLPFFHTTAKSAAESSVVAESVPAGTEDPLDDYRERSLKSLGRFLSSM